MQCIFAALQGPPVELSACDLLRLHGKTLSANGDTVTAVLDSECHWRYRGEQYVRLDITGPLIVRLVRTGQPEEDVQAIYERISVAYGCLHSPAGQLATLEVREGIWRDAITGLSYSSVIFQSERP